MTFLVQNVGEITLVDNFFTGDRRDIYTSKYMDFCFPKHHSERLSIQIMFWNAHGHYFPPPPVDKSAGPKVESPLK